MWLALRSKIANFVFANSEIKSNQEDNSLHRKLLTNKAQALTNLGQYINDVNVKDGIVTLLINTQDEKSLSLIEKAAHTDLANIEYKVKVIINYSFWDYGIIPIPFFLFSTWTTYTTSITNAHK